MPEIKLKPCPFCGRPATTSFWTLDLENRRQFGWIGCLKCDAIIKYYNLPSYLAEAVEKWNRRAHDDKEEGDERCEN